MTASESRTVTAHEINNTIISGYFGSGLGNGVINMVSGAIRQLVVLVPLIWIFTHVFGLSYAWYAMWISDTRRDLQLYQYTQGIEGKSGILNAGYTNS